ncbi:MAG: leucine--tRNA ligase, partial [Phycisphaerales bacterium]|nr:leucine--tRNA ligase [Phycisphaerales bacterium]
HPEGYTATDIVSRYKRMRGHNVLHPMGWDAFGLPAEQYAIQTGVHPAETTRKSIDNFRRQLRRFGFSYDWSREFGTIDEGYYCWTQWVFLEIYNAWFDEQAPSKTDGKPGRARPIAELLAGLESGEFLVGPMGSLVRNASAVTGPIGGEPAGTRRWHELSQDERRAFIDNQRLAYVGESTVNWCPALGTVLANDEVIDGKSERGGHPVLRKPLRQWMFRITAHADRLLRQLDMLAWPASTKKKQADWIGRSEGAEIRFPLLDPRAKSADPKAAPSALGIQDLAVFTTRPDTIFGATYMVVAPEHPLVERVLAFGDDNPGVFKDQARIREYVAKARNRSDVERQESKEKTGVPLGIRCVNPASGEPIPVWVADYVLMGYGTGAIMAVPAHDERDFAFARAFNLPMRLVVRPEGDAPPQFWEKAGERFGDPSYYSAVYVPPVHSPIAIDGLSSSLRGVPGAEDAVEISPLDEGGWCVMVKPPLEDVVIAHLPAPVYQFELGEARPDAGHACNSIGAGVGFDGKESAQAKEVVLAWLEKSGHGRKRVTCRLRDWTFSRQRYWGEPFPIVYDKDGNHYPVSATHLPVKLPALDDYKPVESQDPQPLLAKATSWVETTAGEAGVDPAMLAPDTPVRRETNTMPGSAGSSWYAIRYCDPKNNDRLVGKQAEAYWMGGENPGVDLYVGGDEHSVGHLLYARWWQNVLYDLGHVSTPEPFRTLFHQGLITAHAYQREDKTLVPTDEVTESEGGYVETATGKPVTQIVAKMSKSLKNVVNPDDIIADYGADTFRLYEMYMGPLEMSKPWNTRDIVGLHRFLQRAWRLGVSEQSGEVLTAREADPTLEKLLHRTINKVAGDIEKLSFNTAIAALIEFVNIAGKGEAQTKGDSQPAGTLTRDQLSRLALCLAPFVPHMAEELWHRLGLRDKMGSVCTQAWPSIDEAMLRDDEVEVAVQLSGKVKTRVKVPADASQDAIQSFVLSHPEVEPLVRGKSIKKVIVVPGRLVNIVAV